MRKLLKLKKMKGLFWGQDTFSLGEEKGRVFITQRASLSHRAGGEGLCGRSLVLDQKIPLW